MRDVISCACANLNCARRTRYRGLRYCGLRRYDLRCRGLSCHRGVRIVLLAGLAVALYVLFIAVSRACATIVVSVRAIAFIQHRVVLHVR